MKLRQVSVTLRLSRVFVVMASKHVVRLADFLVQLRDCRVMRCTLVQMVLHVFPKSHVCVSFLLKLFWEDGSARPGLVGYGHPPTPSACDRSRAVKLYAASAIANSRATRRIPFSSLLTKARRNFAASESSP